VKKEVNVAFPAWWNDQSIENDVHITGEVMFEPHCLDKVRQCIDEHRCAMELDLPTSLALPQVRIQIKSRPGEGLDPVRDAGKLNMIGHVRCLHKIARVSFHVESKDGLITKLPINAISHVGVVKKDPIATPARLWRRERNGVCDVESAQMNSNRPFALG